MSRAADAVIAALRNLATPRQVFAEQLNDRARRRADWVRRIIVELSLEEDENFEFEWIDGQTDRGLPYLDDVIGAFVEGAEPDLEQIPTRVRKVDWDTGDITEWDVVAGLSDYRAELETHRQDIASRIASAARDLDGAFGLVRTHLQEWQQAMKSEPKAGASEWGDIQKAWRTAMTLPMRVAGELLEVSSAAIARYETGSRTPSALALASLVNRLIELGPMAGLETIQGVENVHHVQRWLGHEPQPFNIDADPVPALLASVGDRLTELTHRELQFLSALLADRQALAEFISWASTAPVALLGPALIEGTTR